MVEEDTCFIQELLEKPFSRRNSVEQIEIVEKCRPCPQIPELTKTHSDKNKKYLRHFNVMQYESTHWLTGSSKLNKLFCWPCLLFSTDHNVWSKTGFNNLNTLSLAISRHEKSINHINCFLQWNSFRRTRIDHQLDEQQSISEHLHNEKVKKNREILKRLIDTICFLAKQNLPLRCHDESDTSVKKGNYLELLEVISHYDPRLEIYLKESNIFRGTSPAIQNDLIDAINCLITDQIKEDIAKADFVSLILDETSDIINKSRLSTVLRFVDQNCLVQERFLHFTDVSGDRSSAGLLEHVKRVLSDFNCGGKLVAHSYDGAAIIVAQQNDLNKKIKELHPCALFVHFHRHLLNLTFQQSAKNITKCRHFFQTLSCLTAFFSTSPKRTFFALQSFCEEEKPNIAPTIWNFSSGLIITVKEQYYPLISFFQHILNESADWEDDCVLKCRGFLTFLQDFQTCFLVNVLALVFSFTDVLCHILRTKGTNISFCSKKIEELVGKIQKIREDEFDRIYQASVPDENPIKRLRRSEQSEEQDCKDLFYEILDDILVQLRNRFQTVTQLEFFTLLNTNSFEKHCKQFPDSALKCLEKQYGSFFDTVRLKNELSVLYSTAEFRGKPVFNLMKSMHENKLYRGMPEVYKLAKLIVTLPATSATGERTFSALKRVKTYCRTTRGQSRLPSLALMSIEKTLLGYLKTKYSFYDDVTEKFIEKNGGSEWNWFKSVEGKERRNQVGGGGRKLPPQKKRVTKNNLKNAGAVTSFDLECDVKSENEFSEEPWDDTVIRYPTKYDEESGGQVGPIHGHEIFFTEVEPKLEPEEDMDDL